jgi:hypothetical protein
MKHITQWHAEARSRGTSRGMKLWNAKRPRCKSCRKVRLSGREAWETGKCAKCRRESCIPLPPKKSGDSTSDVIGG